MQNTIDEIRGELDKEKGLPVGYSGPMTKTYLKGYNFQLSAQQMKATSDCERNEHGWY